MDLPHLSCLDSPKFKSSHKQTLVPPFRFANVEQGLIRGGYPRKRNIPFLKLLNLKTVLSLTPEALPSHICSDLGTCDYLHFKVDKPKDQSIALDPALMIKSIICIILDPSRYPLYVHCLDGQLVTGTFIYVLRKMQGWGMSMAMNEFQRCIQGDLLPPEMSEYLNLFSNPLDLNFCMPVARSIHALNKVLSSTPASNSTTTSNRNSTSSLVDAIAVEDQPPILISLPTWFWGGTIPFKRHPYSNFKLKLPPTVPNPHVSFAGLFVPDLTRNPTAAINKSSMDYFHGSAPTNVSSTSSFNYASKFKQSGLTNDSFDPTAQSDFNFRLLHTLMQQPPTNASSTFESLETNLDHQPFNPRLSTTSTTSSTNLSRDIEQPAPMDESNHSLMPSTSLSRMVQALNLEGLSN